MTQIKSIQRSRKGQRGTALLVVVALIGFLTIFVSAFPGLAFLQSLTAKKFTTKVQASYLARAGIEIGLGDLAATPELFYQLASESAIDSHHTVANGLSVDVVIMPVATLATSQKLQLTSPTLHSQIMDINSVIQDREAAEPGSRPPLIAIISKGTTGSGKRVRATVTVVALARVSLSGASIVYWFEE